MAGRMRQTGMHRDPIVLAREGAPPATSGSCRTMSWSTWRPRCGGERHGFTAVPLCAFAPLSAACKALRPVCTRRKRPWHGRAHRGLGSVPGVGLQRRAVGIAHPPGATSRAGGGGPAAASATASCSWARRARWRSARRSAGCSAARCRAWSGSTSSRACSGCARSLPSKVALCVECGALLLAVSVPSSAVVRRAWLGPSAAGASRAGVALVFPASTSGQYLRRQRADQVSNIEVTCSSAPRRVCLPEHPGRLRGRPAVQSAAQRGVACRSWACLR